TAQAAQMYTTLFVLVDNALTDEVSDATVEILDGPGAGLRAVTDNNGLASFPVSGTIQSSVHLRVARDGYAPADQSSIVMNGAFVAAGGGLADVHMHGLNPFQLAPGNYTLTIATNG